MTKKDKLLARFCRLPKDFTFEEAVTLFAMFGFVLDTKGGTSGSRVEFRNTELKLNFLMHRPHPTNIVKNYQMQLILDFLRNNNLIQ